MHQGSLSSQSIRRQFGLTPYQNPGMMRYGIWMDTWMSRGGSKVLEYAGGELCCLEWLWLWQLPFVNSQLLII